MRETESSLQQFGEFLRARQPVRKQAPADRGNLLM